MTYSRLPSLDSSSGGKDSPSQSAAKEAMSSFPPKESLRDSTPDLYLALVEDSDDTASTSSGSSSGSISSKASALSSSSRLSGKSWRRKKRELKWEEKVAELKSLSDSSKRRGYFSNKEKRKEVVFGPQVSLHSYFVPVFVVTLRLSMCVLTYPDTRPLSLS